MKRGFLNKDASRITLKKNRASDESKPAQSQEIVAHGEPRFLFSDVLEKPCPPLLNPPFIIRLSGSKGLGMFATRPIARGTLIMRERPVYISQPNLCVFPDQKPFFIPPRSQASPPPRRPPSRRCTTRSPRRPTSGTPGASSSPTRSPQRSRTPPHLPRALPAPVPRQPRLHAERALHVLHGELLGQLFAVRGIAEGEEITIGYTELTAKRAVRRENLEAKFRSRPQERCATGSDDGLLREYEKGERFPEGASLVRVKEMMHWAEEEGLVEAASILGISALRLAQRDKNHSEELKLMVSTMNYIRAVEGNDSPGFAMLATRMSLKTEQLAAILDKSTPETIDYSFLSGCWAEGEAMNFTKEWKYLRRQAAFVYLKLVHKSDLNMHNETSTYEASVSPSIPTLSWVEMAPVAQFSACSVAARNGSLVGEIAVWAHAFEAVARELGAAFGTRGEHANILNMISSPARTGRRAYKVTENEERSHLTAVFRPQLPRGAGQWRRWHDCNETTLNLWFARLTLGNTPPYSCGAAEKKKRADAPGSRWSGQCPRRQDTQTEACSSPKPRVHHEKFGRSGEEVHRKLLFSRERSHWTEPQQQGGR
ncbi:hypothetical protein B0H14DRAFT_3167515 [Mycena olivaceomarginata]|nr:hypothetical protein B0H14DRAFT_3167515 [Mycena olivaceomarginata]